MENKRSFFIRDILNQSQSLNLDFYKGKFEQKDDLLSKLVGELKVGHVIKDGAFAEIENKTESFSLEETTSSDELKTYTNKNKQYSDYINFNTTSNERLLNQNSELDQSASERKSGESAARLTYHKDCEQLVSLASRSVEMLHASTSDPHRHQRLIVPPDSLMSAHVSTPPDRRFPSLSHLHRLGHHAHLVTKTRKRDKKVRRPRTNFTEEQLQELERLFVGQKYLNVGERVEAAGRLGLNEIQVKTWYQNRRTKWKRQNQLKVEYFGQTIHHHQQGSTAYRTQPPDPNHCHEAPVKPHPVYLPHLMATQPDLTGGNSASAALVNRPKQQQQLMAYPGGGYFLVCGEAPILHQGLSLSCLHYP